MNFRTVLNIRALSNIRDEAQAQSIAEETDSGLRSLRLDDTWDLTLSAGGDLASAGGTVRIVQDVASYVRTFQGEPYYAQQDGNVSLAPFPPPNSFGRAQTPVRLKYPAWRRLIRSFPGLKNVS